MQEKNKACVERCNIFVRRGFTVVALSSNNSIGRLCVLRKSDFVTGKTLFLVEFYNAISLPVIFFEKAIPICNTSLESIIWLGNKVFVSCADGSLMLFSPFSSYTKRFQVCASAILAIDYLSLNKIALGTDSSQILVVEYNESQPDKVIYEPSVDLIKTIKLSSEERIICLATSRQNDLVAVGLLNAIRLFDLKSNKRVNMIVPNVSSSATVIWSLVFVDDLLFSGDSRGKVTIYNTKTGGILKVVHSHQGAVLCLATNGKSVFACGVDHRIQVISGISLHEKRFDWATVGQRLFHENDVRSMACMGERWLISGGAEHDFVISDHQWTVAHPILKKACSVAYQQNGLILMRHPKFLELWFKQALPQHLTDATESSNYPKQEAVFHTEVESGPKKLAQINSSSYILESCISPDGNFIGIADESGLRVLCVDRKFDEMPTKMQKFTRPDAFIQKFWDSQSYIESSEDADEVESCSYTCLLATNENLYYSEGEFAVKRLNFHRKSTELLGEKKNAGNILKMCVNPLESLLVAISTNCQVLQIDLNTSDVSNELIDEEADIEIEMVKDLKFQYTAIECAFMSDSVVLFLCAEMDSQLVFFDVPTQKCLKVLSKSNLQLGHNEFLCHLSDVQSEKVIAVSNKAKIRIFENCKKGQVVMHLKERVECKSSISNGKSDSWRKFKSRVEPFWGFEDCLSMKKNSKERKRKSFESCDPKRNVLLIGTVAEKEPTTKPMKIKRHDRN